MKSPATLWGRMAWMAVIWVGSVASLGLLSELIRIVLIH
jgi:hypothetical protein